MMVQIRGGTVEIPNVNDNEWDVLFKLVDSYDENSNEDLLKALEKQIKYSKTKFEQMIDLSIYVKFISHLVVSLHSG
ncbi:unnamed protein product [Didymodactylos carnosus]|uniref:Uncharacterized protein n=1 Tax=Didymodactylos carnosus TaxID=1234261 RepID=A0A8S2DMA7_9BILA|nr:unnamed protein product [Didymodactylos carnosus]CAF3729295.1 unnamed protein product [Didymodactylos carnosus]